MDHPLKVLRENSGCTQLEVSKRAGISGTRLSLAEYFLSSLTPKEEQVIRTSIVELTKERSALVLKDADPRLQRAMKTIDASPSKKELFENTL